MGIINMRAPKKFGDRVVQVDEADEQRMRDDYAAYRDGEKPPKAKSDKDEGKGEKTGEQKPGDPNAPPL